VDSLSVSPPVDSVSERTTPPFSRPQGADPGSGDGESRFSPDFFSGPSPPGTVSEHAKPPVLPGPSPLSTPASRVAKPKPSPHASSCAKGAGTPDRSPHPASNDSRFCLGLATPESTGSNSPFPSYSPLRTGDVTLADSKSAFSVDWGARLRESPPKSPFSTGSPGWLSDPNSPSPRVGIWSKPASTAGHAPRKASFTFTVPPIIF
jgi:hypothetical protein